MGRKRGFFAEVQHQAALAERNRQRAAVAAERDRQRALKEAERARVSADRARAAAAKSDARARAEAEREAKRLHVVAQESLVESLNVNLESRLADIDNILQFTLSIDDYVDLEKLRQVSEHPDFSSAYEVPTPEPAPIVAPPEPVHPTPEPVKGLFGRKKREAEARAKADVEHAAAQAAWSEEVAAIPRRQLEQLTTHSEAERTRLRELEGAREQYEKECQERTRQAEDHNAELDILIEGVAAGRAEAMDEYVGIVLGNSVYPDEFDVEVDYAFDEQTRELRLDLELPSPEQIPTARAFKYVKAKGEITESAQTQKEQKERYRSIVLNTALRTLHEVFEADRSGTIETISLAAGTQYVDPATGQDNFATLLAVAVDRETFLGIDLAKAVPEEALKHLGATVSKNPHALQAIDTTLGVRAH